MNNNPILYNDPEGDLAFLPILIGAAVGGTIGGIQHGWEGVWKGALVGAVGGTLGQFGGGSLLNDIAWGAAEGGITGGIGAELNGGSFGEGFWKGALIGGGATFAYNLPDAIQNSKAGFGFNTDIGSFQNAAKDAVSGGFVDAAKAQRALDFWTDRFGGPSLNYISTTSSVTGKLQASHVNQFTGDVNISGVNFIQGSKHVTRTIVHETAHYNKTLIWHGGKVGGKPTGRIHTEGVAAMGGAPHGTIGYYDAIRGAGKYNMGYSAVAKASANGFSSPLAPVAWKSFGWKKWLYQVPRRF